MIKRLARQMRPNNRDLNLINWHRSGRLALRPRRRCSGRPKRQTSDLLIRRAQSQQQRILPRRRDQRHARRQPIRQKTIGQRQRTQIHQVDEVGVIAQSRVKPQRIRLHLCDRVDRRHGRHQQHIHLPPFSLGGRPQGLKFIHSLKYADCIMPSSVAENTPSHRQNGVRAIRDKIFQHRKPLGHPRPLIQQLGGRGKRFVINPRNGVPTLCKAFNGLVKLRFRRPIAMKFQINIPRHANAKALGIHRRLAGNIPLRAREGITLVISCRDCASRLPHHRKSAKRSTHNPATCRPEKHPQRSAGRATASCPQYY